MLVLIMDGDNNEEIIFFVYTISYNINYIKYNVDWFYNLFKCIK